MPTSKQRHHSQAWYPSETVAPCGGPETTDRRRGTGLGKIEERGSATHPKRVIDAMCKKR